MEQRLKRKPFFVIKKNICGVERIYPHNETARKVANLIRKKTFSKQEMAAIIDVGCFEVVELDENNNVIVTETRIEEKAGNISIFD